MLSIGYSACHWCHVMEEESFSNDEIAGIMNEGFICIKVDREERPDLDKTYQLAHFLLSRTTGGWPLTVFLSPEQVPFFTGTYFPPRARRGQLSLPDVLERVRSAWATRRDEIQQQNEVIAKAIVEIDSQAKGDRLPGADVAHKCASQLASSFDLEHGGLGKAPKFPQVPSLKFAVSAFARGELSLRDGTEVTMEAMASGGLHDHVGGGFFRYCVDPVWDIPHFEKMLSDNAQLLDLYASASVVLHQPSYGYVARSTARWMLDEMRQDGGGFSTAIDADSEGEEGRYYVWPQETFVSGNGVSNVEALLDIHNIEDGPNFEGSMLHIHQGIRNGYRVPGEHERKALDELRAMRDKRVRPALDDKVLASSCGLAAYALARAGSMLGEHSWMEAARKAVAFVDSEMFVDGTMRTAWREGRCSDIPAFLDDHAYMLMARLQLLADGCGQDDLDAATKAADCIIEMFDDQEGGLLFTAKGAPRTIRDIRTCDDGPVPSGNGIAVSCLMSLGWIAGRPDYLERAEAIISGFSDLLSKAPAHAPTMALACDDLYRTPAVVTLTGTAEKINQWRRELAMEQVGGAMVLSQPGDREVAEELAKPQPSDGTGPVATLCRGNVCLAPMDDLQRLRKELARTFSKGA